VKDKYFYPTTIAKCHERMKGILHTNKTQADHIASLQSRLSSAEVKERLLEMQVLTFQTKLKLLLDKNK